MQHGVALSCIVAVLREGSVWDGDGVVGRHRELAWIGSELGENAGPSMPARDAGGDLTLAKQQELFPTEASPEPEAKKRKRARGCVVCDRKLDPDAKRPASFMPEEWSEWRAWLCAACTKTYEKRLKHPPLDRPGAVLGAIEWASTRTWAFARHFLTSRATHPSKVCRAGAKTARSLRQEHAAIERAAFTRGVLAAAGIAEEFDHESANPSRVSDIVRCKLNAVRLAKPRRNAAHNNSFAQGVALALADLNRKFDQPAMVADVLEETGLTIKQLRAAGVEEHDLRELKKCLRKKGRE